MKVKSISLLIIILIVSSFFIGCQSKEEKEQLTEITEKAKIYIEEKYGKSFEIEDSFYRKHYNGLFETDSSSAIIVFADGTEVIHIEDTDSFVDNHQSTQINDVLEDIIWASIVDSVENYAYEPSLYTVTPKFNYYENESDSFYHNYYDGDVETFLKNEKIDISLSYIDNYDVTCSSSLYVFVKNENECKEKITAFNNSTTEKYKDNLVCNFGIIFLTKELYDEKVTLWEREHEGFMVPSIGDEGCFATGYLSEYRYQHYIKIMDGVYITSNERDFILEDGDITLKSVMQPSDIQKIMDEVNKKWITNHPDQQINRYIINSSLPVYELEFSDRIKERNKQYGEDSTFSVYFKFIPSELNLSNDNNLYSFPVRNNNYTSYESYEVAKGFSNNGGVESVYVFKTNHKDYYWIGVETTKRQ